MLEVSKSFPSYQFIVAKAPGLDDDFYNSLLQPYNNVRTVSGKTYDLLMQAKAALVTSGTATLETALFGVPEVVCYKGGWISYSIARMLIKVNFISLVNLIMKREVVKELIQHDLTPENLVKELRLIISDRENIERMKNDFITLRKELGGSGASVKTAQAIYRELTQ